MIGNDAVLEVARRAAAKCETDTEVAKGRYPFELDNFAASAAGPPVLLRGLFLVHGVSGHRIDSVKDALGHVWQLRALTCTALPIVCYLTAHLGYMALLENRLASASDLSQDQPGQNIDAHLNRS